MQKNHAHILIAPRITEKAASLAEHGCYVFDIAPDATKHDITRAVRTIFKVTPRSVRVVSLPHKVRATRGTNRTGAAGGGKKAYVYLKAGETIELA
jgi:large subunit ribosomal protein L23